MKSGFKVLDRIRPAQPIVVFLLHGSPTMAATRVIDGALPHICALGAPEEGMRKLILDPEPAP
ncbi:MAG TPA: hypothetical protein VGL31_01385 [Xanthobacteraceae bacterium]|jgi:hypothetical protein